MAEGDPRNDAVAETTDEEIADVVEEELVIEVLDDEELDQPAGSAVTIDVLANDGAVDPTTVQLVDPETGDPVEGDLVIPGEGTGSVDPTTGAITFTPEPGFEGDPTPVDYVVTTVLGEVLSATATVTFEVPDPIPNSAPIVDPRPSANSVSLADDSNSGVLGDPVTVDILTNDAAVDSASVRLMDPNTGLAVTGDLVVNGEGTWSFSASTGEVEFTPEPGFRSNPTPISYQALGTDGKPVTPATVSVTYVGAETPTLAFTGVKEDLTKSAILAVLSGIVAYILSSLATPVARKED